MSTQLKKQKTSHREKIDDYHRKVKKVIDVVPPKLKISGKLQDYLEQDETSSREPKEIKLIREVWEEARCAGIAAGLFQDLDRSEFKIFIRDIVYDDIRRRFYRQSLNSRLNSEDEVRPLPVVEMAQRYNYYLYKKGRKNRGLGQGPKFQVWIAEADPAIQNPFSRN